MTRQALILARTIGWTRNLADINVEGLFPKEMGSLSPAEFMDALPSLDASFAARVEEAKDTDCVLRYVAAIKDGQCTVGLKAVPKDLPVGRLRGTDNILQLHTDVYYKLPLVIQGSGAGAEVTASGVVGDMVEIAVRHVV